MIKKTLYLFIILCISVSGCGQPDTADTQNTQNNFKHQGDYIIKSLDIDRENIENPFCIYDDNIIYSIYEYEGAENEQTYLAFYRYHIENAKTYPIGKVKNPYIFSLNTAEIDGKLYFYCNEVISGSNAADEKVEHSLYQIDLQNDTLQKQAADSTDQTLIFVTDAGNKVISFKGILDGNKGISYLDTFDVTDGNQPSFQILLSKEIDNQKNKGDVIYHFAESNGILYVLVHTYASFEDTSWSIEKYDLDGTYIGRIHLDSEITDLIDEERVGKFEVFGNYAFLRTFSQGGVVFDISSEQTVPKLIRELDLDIAMPVERKDASYLIFYSRDTGEMWRFDVASSTLRKLDLPYEQLNYVFLDADNKILISSGDTTIYCQVDKIPVKIEIPRLPAAD